MKDILASKRMISFIKSNIFLPYMCLTLSVYGHSMGTLKLASYPHLSHRVKKHFGVVTLF